MVDTCAVKKCKLPLEIIYLGKPICGKHWDQLADNKKKLRAALGLKEEIDGPDTVRLHNPRSKDNKARVPRVPSDERLSDDQVQLEVLGLYKRPTSMQDLQRQTSAEPKEGD